MRAHAPINGAAQGGAEYRKTLVMMGHRTEFGRVEEMFGPLPVRRKSTKKDGGVAPAVRQARSGKYSYQLRIVANVRPWAWMSFPARVVVVFAPLV